MTNEKTLARIRSLAIPPAYTDVWICPAPTATSRRPAATRKGRKQYRYHPSSARSATSAKYEHMMDFAEALPRIRGQVHERHGAPGLPREKVLATVVHLLETTLIRVGNEDYAKENKSYGLTTLRNRHVDVEGGELRFHFKGKSGKIWKLDVRDRRVARIVKACQELPGQQLFQYVDETARRTASTSADVNAYLQEISGRDITAKDFRTWAGTVLAAMALQRVRGRRQRGQGQEEHARRDRARCRPAGQHPDDLPQVLRPPGDRRTAYLSGELLARDERGGGSRVARRPPGSSPRRPPCWRCSTSASRRRSGRRSRGQHDRRPEFRTADAVFGSRGGIAFTIGAGTHAVPRIQREALTRAPDATATFTVASCRWPSS